MREPRSAIRRCRPAGVAWPILSSRTKRRMSEKVIAGEVGRRYDGRGTPGAEDAMGRGSAVATRPRRARA